jgi:hypothetical protein
MVSVNWRHLRPLPSSAGAANATPDNPIAVNSVIGHVFIGVPSQFVCLLNYLPWAICDFRSGLFVRLPAVLFCILKCRANIDKSGISGEKYMRPAFIHPPPFPVNLRAPFEGNTIP